MADKCKTCVVGGGVGGRLSLDALVASEKYELVGVTDLRPEVCAELEQKYPGVKSFTDHNKMFDACNPDVVCVSTYAPSHLSITKDALARPIKGILVEKPLGDTAVVGAEVIGAVKARGIPMAVPHGLLVVPHGAEIIRKIAEGAIGDLQLVEIECSGWDLINAGIHWINFFVVASGNEPIESVQCNCDTTTRTYRDGMQVETESVCMIVTKSGVRCVLHMGDEVSSLGGASTLFRFIGSAGMLTFEGWKPGYTLLNAECPKGTFFDPQGDGRKHHQVHLDNMAACIDSGKPDYSVAESSLKALEIIESAYRSSQARCKVKFPFADFKEPEDSDWVPGIPYSGEGGGRDGRQFG
ncbi:MAG: Gfo/Idh/MocA family oxidoreductase [Planctomycetes bacterium]|nr:Gfo/Idh/MocA family oxidoreductase [Planctomycetota bacterium]